jgi:hypothetical protein
MQRTSSPELEGSRAFPPEPHREASSRALAQAQRNPIMSVDQLFAVAQTHALLAIEEQLTQLVAELGRQRRSHVIA